MRPALIFASLVASSVAQTTTRLFMPGVEENSLLMASIVASDATATTFSIACPVLLEKTCNVPTSFSVTQGPSTGHFIFSESNIITLEVGCTFNATTTAICSASVTSLGEATTSTSTLTDSSISSLFYNVILTDNLSAMVTVWVTARTTVGVVASNLIVASRNPTETSAKPTNTSPNSASASATAKAGGMPSASSSGVCALCGLVVAVAVAAILL